jgi:hypothetical protein
MLFFNPLYSFTFLVWDGLNNAFDHWPIVVDDTCKYGVFEDVRIVKFFNTFVTQGNVNKNSFINDANHWHIRKKKFRGLLILILYAYILHYPIQYIKNCWVRLLSNYNIKYICTIYDETIFIDGRCFRGGSHRYTFFSIRYILLHFWYEVDWIMHLIIDQS